MTTKAIVVQQQGEAAVVELPIPKCMFILSFSQVGTF